jgi:hypothetical protein
MSEYEQDTLRTRYQRGETERQPALDKAREFAKLTIPKIFPPEGKTMSTRLYRPYNGKNAAAVNSIVTKLVTAMFPVGQPFFRLDVDELAMKRLAAQIAQAFPDPAQAQAAAAEQAQVIAEGLAKIERSITQEIQASALRSKLSEALKQVVIGGVSLVHVINPKTVRVHRLDTFVITLDPVGTIIELVVKESVSPRTLKQDIRQACNIESDKLKEGNVDVYTGVCLREDGRYDIHQEINDIRVPGSDGEYPADKLPWVYLRFYPEDGESYSRGYVEEYCGYMQSGEGLAKSIVQASAAAAKVLFLVKNGRTSRRKLASAANGDFIDGDANDVSTLQLNKSADLSVAKSTLDSIDTGIGMAFLVPASVQRDGERVTATEFSRLANSLDEQLGGIYSMLAEAWQRPFVTIVMAQKESAGTMPPLPKGIVQVSVATGIDALGRGADADRLERFVASLAQLNPTALSVIKMDTLVSRLAVAQGVDTANLIKTSAELAAEQQQQMRQQAMMQAAPGVIQEVAKQGVANGMAQANGGQAPA